MELPNKWGEELEQVIESLKDALTKEKMNQISDSDILEELERFQAEKGEEMEAISHTFQFHPLRSVNSVVRFFVNKFYKRKEDPDQSKEEESDSCEPSLDEGVEEDEEYMEYDVYDSAVVLPPSKEFLRSLCLVYPDIDPQYLNQTCERFYNRPEEIQTFLEENGNSIPARRTVQRVQFNMLQGQVNPRTEKLWQCPECRAWQIVDLNRKEDTLACNEIVSCGEFCIKCNKRSHHPFTCRKMSVRALQEENEVDIFKRISATADEIRGNVRIFNMQPKNDVNYSDPLDILYSMAESTFLRMLRKSAAHYGNIVNVGPAGLLSGPRTLNMSVITNRNAISSIQYIENETLKEKFMICKKHFEAKGIPDGERLVFHGTSARLDSIMDQGLLLSKCKRFAHGYGIYFSEFPDISNHYGSNLLLVRVMLGRAYQGSEHKIPKGFNSKLIKQNSEGNCEMIIVENEEQILPAFNIKVKW